VGPLVSDRFTLPGPSCRVASSTWSTTRQSLPRRRSSKSATESESPSPVLPPTCDPSLSLLGTTITGLQRHPPTRLFLPPSHAVRMSPWCQLPGLTNRSRSPPRHFPPLFSRRSELTPNALHRSSATPFSAIAAAGALSQVSSSVQPSSMSPPVAASPHTGLSYNVGRLPKPELHPSHRRCSWRLAAVERLHRSKPTATSRRVRATRAMFSGELLPLPTYRPLC
jgi:hypothetical protein